MGATEALRSLAEVTAYQWGMVTSGQASARGVDRLDLSRLAHGGHLERLAHGVYKLAGAPGDQLDDMRAVWLSTDPKRLAHERATGDIVFAGSSAARLHRIGDLWERRYDFVTSARRQSQRPEVRYRQRTLDPRDVATVEGLPAMSIECTIADLFNAEADTSHIANALRDASRKHRLDIDRLRQLLAPHAKREGLAKGDGAALLERLMQIAGIDAESLATKIAATPGIGTRVVAKYLEQLGDETLKKALSAQIVPARPESSPSLDEATTKKRVSSITPSAMKRARDAVQPAPLDSEEALRMANAAHVAASKIDVAVSPELMVMIENAQEAVNNA